MSFTPTKMNLGVIFAVAQWSNSTEDLRYMEESPRGIPTYDRS